ncbi:MAG TPA: dihydroorotase [Burkholderiales bacterium]|nr:dihydroorotase [Burkholderiales bacterium]
MNQLTIIKPDDWHLHVRDGEALRAVLPHSVRRFARAIIMPNLRPPIASTQSALAYRERIRAALPRGARFEPLMTLYLTEETTPDQVRSARASGAVYAIKYYPAGATTHSESGVTDLRRCLKSLEAMAETGLPLLVHGEVTDTQIDVFDREKAFIEHTLGPLVQRLPGLKIVLEHISTADAVRFVLAAPPNVAATITAHHLLLNRNALFQDGLRPHHYCLPLLKHEEHRQALLRAIASGEPKFFLGTDSAPHARTAKEAPCGCAGVYTAHAAIELYAEAFEAAGALGRLEAFASFHGADFYGLPRNSEQLTLVRREWTVPDELPYGASTVVPLRAGERVRWSVV